MTEHVRVSKTASSLPTLFSSFLAALQSAHTLDQVWHTRSQSKSKQTIWFYLLEQNTCKKVSLVKVDCFNCFSSTVSECWWLTAANSEIIHDIGMHYSKFNILLFTRGSIIYCIYLYFGVRKNSFSSAYKWNNIKKKKLDNHIYNATKILSLCFLFYLLYLQSIEYLEVSALISKLQMP